MNAGFANGHLTRAQLALPIAFIATVFSWSACGGGGPSEPVVRSPTPLTNQAVASCDAAAEDEIQLTSHGVKAANYIATIQEALAAAANHAELNYGWVPSAPVCVHAFSDPDAFVEGLEALGGFDHATAEGYRLVFGTVGRDRQSGRDAIFLNAGMVAVQSWVAFVAAHEYFHVVEEHVGGTAGSFPVWFLEGVAEWEPVKFLGPPFPNWLTLLRDEERQGQEFPLSTLVTWEQWRQAGREASKGANPLRVIHKARAAAMFLERIAGPTAAAQILRGNEGGDLTGFGQVFQEVSGLGLQEFEIRLKEFISEGE